MADSINLAGVRRVLLEHREQIIRDYGAVGVGIGKKDFSSEEYVIVVYLKSKQDVPPQPVTLEGVLLQFVVTGDISAHSA